MIDTLTVRPLDKGVLEDIGMTWHTDHDGSDYISSELVRVSGDQAEAYYAAANALYDMFVAAAGQVVTQRRYAELGIPENLIELIEDSWAKDDLHLYGRFDLAGGLDGLPIKLIEFNADTPTSLFETAIVQWAILRANGMDETRQFNNVHEMLRDQFRRLVTGNDPLDLFRMRYRDQAILFSSIRDLAEDERTVRYLQEIAHEAGFYNDFSYLDEVGFIADQGVFNKDQQLADWWFKLFPWEDIGGSEAELTAILEQIAGGGRTRFINPAYTLLFQSKGLMKVLCELYPDSPYLLHTDFTPPARGGYVRKKMFGREGANMTLMGADGQTLAATDGPYSARGDIYQELAELPRDSAGNYYQAGVFYVWEACGLGFRRGGMILDNLSKFVGHIVE